MDKVEGFLNIILGKDQWSKNYKLIRSIPFSMAQEIGRLSSKSKLAQKMQNLASR